MAGFVRSELGVGEAARSVIAALDAQRVPVMPVHGRHVPDSRQSHTFPFVGPESAPFPINLICINPGELPGFIEDAGPDFARDRYTIGFWWWEVSRFPDEWMKAFRLVDEVWVGTEHVARTLRATAEVPIIKIRVPVTLPPIIPYSRDELGLPSGFVFLFLFDFRSSFDRKNPLGVIEAFRRAFSSEDGASLVVKCINQGSDPENYGRLVSAAAMHPNVHILHRHLSADKKNAMIAACDCYVSLHRAEGFALTPAEAMYLGKPVVATRYSGNLEFMTDDNSYLVDCRMTTIGRENWPYPADGEWADPDVDQAAGFLRHVFDEPDDARQRGAQAAVDIRKAFSLEATGAVMLDRLGTIRHEICNQAPTRRLHPTAGRVGGGHFHRLMRRNVTLAAGQWLAPVSWLSLRRVLGVLRSGTGCRLDIGRGMFATIRESALEVRRRRRSRRDRVTLRHGESALEVAGLLAQLRRQDAELRELHARLAVLERSLCQSGHPIDPGSPTRPVHW